MARAQEQRPPSGPGVVAVLAVLAVAAAGAALGVGTFVAAYGAGLRPWRYPGLSPLVTVSYALVGTLLGAPAWRLVRQRARRPRTVLAWSVGAVAAVSLGADLVAGLDGRVLVGLVTAGQHVVVIAATVAVLSRVMPVPPDRDVPPARSDAVAPTRRRVLAAVLVVVAGIWIAVNKAVEGPTLLVVTARHGLTVADLFSVAALVTAGQLLRPART